MRLFRALSHGSSLAASIIEQRTKAARQHPLDILVIVSLLRHDSGAPLQASFATDLRYCRGLAAAVLTRFWSAGLDVGGGDASAIDRTR